MINSTYTADISGAVAYDPNIAGSIVSGLAGQMDPATEAYAASYELRTDALMLQNQNDISNPTVLDVRAVYQFGAGVGPEVATADDSENIAQLTGLSAASLAANGLSSLKHGWSMAGHRHRKTRLRNSKSKRVGSVTWRAS